MNFIDNNAYCSKLRKTDPLIKILTAIAVLFTVLLANSYLVSAITIFIAGWVIVKFGGTKLKILLKLTIIPVSFLIIGVITIIIQRADNTNNLLMPVKIFSYYYGFGINNLDFAGMLMLRAIAAVFCMYFIALTTPMTEIFSVLGRLRFPKLIIELMELIYRFIFVLTQTANQIYIAQASRLGYNGLEASYKSLGLLVSVLFVRAYKRSDKIYIALESRGYDGELGTVELEYNQKPKHYLYGIAFVAFLIIIFLIENRLMS